MTTHVSSHSMALAMTAPRATTKSTTSSTATTETMTSEGMPEGMERREREPPQGARTKRCMHVLITIPFGNYIYMETSALHS